MDFSVNQEKFVPQGEEIDRQNMNTSAPEPVKYQRIKSNISTIDVPEEAH